MIEVNGKETRVIVSDSQVTIIKKGLFGRERSNRTIKRSAISGVDFKKAGVVRAGFIEIHTGQAESVGDRPVFAADRPNCITFFPHEAAAFAPVAQELLAAEM
ncbi:MAG: hypothetical protein ACR2O7_03120 [Parasphingorhabdus sp.]